MQKTKYQNRQNRTIKRSYKNSIADLVAGHRGGKKKKSEPQWHMEDERRPREPSNMASRPMTCAEASPTRLGRKIQSQTASPVFQTAEQTST